MVKKTQTFIGIVTVSRPGKCPSYYGNTSDVCSLDPCNYDADCVSATAKCCYTGCYSTYYSQRCIDVEALTSKSGFLFFFFSEILVILQFLGILIASPETYDVMFCCAVLKSL